MRDKLKNDLLLSINSYVDSETLKMLDQKIDIILSWILGNVTRIPRHELPQTLDFSDFLPLFT